MRLCWLVSLLVLLLTAPYWLGLLSGLWHQRVYAGIIRRRGLWLLLQWPFVQVGRWARWLYDWCPPIAGALFVGCLAWDLWVATDILLRLTTPAEAPAPVGHARFVTGVVEMPGAGRIRWELGDTEAVIRNTAQDALKCSLDPQRLYGSAGKPLVHRRAVLRLPAEEMLAGVYCGALSTTNSQSVGIRVGPAPPRSEGPHIVAPDLLTALWKRVLDCPGEVAVHLATATAACVP